MPDAIALLTEDHRRVEALFDDYDRTKDPEVALQVCLELSVHAIVEEEMLYGLYSAKVDHKGAAEARAEHAEAKLLIQAVEAMAPDSDEMPAAMAELKASVQHHVQEEENEMFPKLLSRLPETAASLGNDILARKTAVEARIRADRTIGLGT